MRIFQVVGIALLAGAAAVPIPQEELPRQTPDIWLSLPPDMASETVHINYFMTGSFGGYGGYVATEKGRGSYEISASVNGKPAATVKIIAYLPGCEIVKLEIAMQGTSQARTLLCKPLDTVPLHGRISPPSITGSPGTEVEVIYEAAWDHEFFGIMDGMVTAIHLATVIPDVSGDFEVELPDYFKQANLGNGAFQFTLRNSSNRNIIAALKPPNTPQFIGGLAVRSSYAPFVLFLADTSASTPAKSDSDSH